MPQEAQKGIQPNIRRLRGIEVLVPCQSAWNTLLLPVKKPHTNDYRPVQDLREVNKRVMDIHPTVPNPYTLLSSLVPSSVWYTVLDWKDAFFSLPLAPHSQPLFAFEWHDLEEGYSRQLTWTRLPQGFKNSPTIFNEALHEDLGEYRRTHPNLTLLQYVDDILIAADTAEDCKQGTRDLLASLGALGYWASVKKAQICRERKLDPVAAGWPPCLRIIAATALLVKDADKLTLGQEIWITTPHAIEGVLKQPPDRWMSNTRMTHYQSLLLNPPRVRFHPSAALNPATLLPDPDLDDPLHDCAGILEQVHGLWKDLTDQPLPDADVTWFTDGSSFVWDGSRYAGAAVVTETDTIWAEALPSRTSAQRAELVALTKALTLGVGRRLNIYTDSRYAFTTAHVHGTICHERGLLTAERQTIKNKQEILNLLSALWLPAKLAIIHCQGHQKADDPVARGNRRADQAAKAVALFRSPPWPYSSQTQGTQFCQFSQDIPWRSYSALGSFSKHRRRRGDTFSGRVEAYPTKHETAQTVAKKLLEDILPRYGFPAEIGSDNGPAFVSQHKLGDWVYVKRHRRETLEPRWKGPYVVVLTTPTPLKVDGVATWVHHTHVRPADPSAIWEDFITQWSITRDQCNPLKLKLRRSQPA
ncbi:hypothetical protein QTO34_014178 [Cnephaeus nilssonii]|uniref:Uncharacterized protein n=1 Tax=Cnephaeus nilssonii TaxID=3371016 RepID=A0AA40HAJ8_CNENI|nr:hypothetical protein QTO34_014178 [Eptesicus nilssonii]